MWQLVLVLHALQLAAAAKQTTYKFINGGPTPLEIRWLREGLDDAGDGVVTGHLPAASGKKGGTSEQYTSSGHAFRLHAADGRRSPSFAHDGGSWNLVGVREGPEGGLDVEVLGLKQLRHLALAPKSEQRMPRLRYKLPADVASSMADEFAPAKVQPRVHASSKLRGGVLPCSDEDKASSFELVFTSALSATVDIRWLWKVIDSEDFEELVGGPASSAGLSAVSQSLANMSAATSAQQPCLGSLAATAGQAFYLESKNGDGSLRRSPPLLYNGELRLIAAVESSSSEADITIESLDEDAVKIFLSDVAYKCEESNAADFWRCFEEGAVLPLTGLHLSPAYSRTWFMKLWGSLEHWRLCSYQPATAPLETIQLQVEAKDGFRTLQGDILRKDPLVLAIHNVSTHDECRGLDEIAGSPDKLQMAFVSSGGHSKARRTLSKNLYPDWNDPSNVLTIMANRFFDLARQASGFELYPPGQEPVNWLFYKPGFEYRPHCDGRCGQGTNQRGERVATSLLYCTVAEKGGGTVFPPDKTKLIPTPGMLLFFAYNPDLMGLTQHSACPVLKGRKTTATQWYREGVSHERDWEKVNRGEL
eukprot:TRINITY_DN91018_c0_g1_i1.p1 TRINITY_DN91018_c0_g1~~TRINITY_DN91018_c0_g1_i1.p1  ORF type:complete len:590 (-),score=129.06 TRINITY_DN91018_c0_g1_i1:130-1899(-)